MTEFPQYDEVHVISDLHMGGMPGFQILKETGRLAGYIRRVAAQRPKHRVALILNGDVIDTLAEDIGGYVAVDKAIATVARIMEDKSFAGVWAALKEFAQTEGRTLVLIIGNHDIELAFPTVQRYIVSYLAEDNLEARARIEFSTTGAGYTCLVGNARVYCTHGNEVDPWNYNRYEDLAKVGRRLNAGVSLAPSEWIPNAGTRMVKDVMNAVKKKYAWIDLLKPETSAALGTLLVLDPSQAAKLQALLPIVGERVRGADQVDQRLSAEGFVERKQADAPPLRLDQLLGANLKAGLMGGDSLTNITADQMLANAERDFRTSASRLSDGDGTLGTPQLIWDRLTGWLTGISGAEALRRALKDWLAGDETFYVDDKDDTYKDVTAAVGSSVDFIVTGHTHLERAIEIGPGRFYFNCGTWIRLLRFTDDLLKDEKSFIPVYGVLKAGRMESIDNAKFNGQDFVLNQTSAVCIKEQGGKVVGQLIHIVGDGSSDPIPQKTFPRPS